MGVFTREDLGVFLIPEVQPRVQAIKAVLGPKLIATGKELIDELAVSTGEELHSHLAVHSRSRKPPPEETWLALGPTTKAYKKDPYFAIAVSNNAVHVRVHVVEECERKAEIGQDIIDRCAELARYAQQLGALRNFEEWDFEGLPDPAPAAEQLFWSTLGHRVNSKKSSRFDIGVGWKGAEALRLDSKRIAKAIARLMPLFHLVAFDRWRF